MCAVGHLVVIQQCATSSALSPVFALSGTFLPMPPSALQFYQDIDGRLNVLCSILHLVAMPLPQGLLSGRQLLMRLQEATCPHANCRSVKLTFTNRIPHFLATSLASTVLLVPGGPCISHSCVSLVATHQNSTGQEKGAGTILHLMWHSNGTHLHQGLRMAQSSLNWLE